MVAMFFTVSVVNNYALNLNIAMPLHMIFRSVSIVIPSFPPHVTSLPVISASAVPGACVLPPSLALKAPKTCTSTKLQLSCGESNLALKAQLPFSLSQC